MVAMFADPSQTYYGGSADALAQQRADALAQMRAAQALGNQALGQAGSPYGTPDGGAMGVATRLQQQGGVALDNVTGRPLTLDSSGRVASAMAMGAAGAFDPGGTARQSSQVAADQAARNAMGVARSGGPNAALAMRQALQVQGAQSMQAQQQAGLMAAQLAQLKAQTAIQGAGVVSQIGAQQNATALQQQQQDRQFALAQLQGGVGITQQEAARAQQLAQFREGLYSGRDQNVNSQQLQADQMYQQMMMQAAAQKAAFTGQMVSAGAGVLGAAGGMV